MQHTSTIPDQVDGYLTAVIQLDLLDVDDILFLLGSLIIECGGIVFLVFQKIKG